MNKRAKFLLLSLIQTLGFLFFIELPYDSRIYGILTGLALTIFATWYGLGLIYYSDWKSRLAAIIMPIMWFFGLAMFVSVLELPWWWDVPVLLLFGSINYAIYLVLNVFMVPNNSNTGTSHHHGNSSTDTNIASPKNHIIGIIMAANRLFQSE
jgi:glucan phosphoethanolaminetransferase (alkaline phosphatase superfamily)